MAAFKDNPLKQVVDDLNIQNAATIPFPLTEEMCELLNPIQDNTLGAFANTRATLRVTGSEGGYPSGEVEVKYRRLKIETLAGAMSTSFSFLGEANQTKTLLEILQKYIPTAAEYVLPHIVDNGPYNLTRDNLPIILTPKNGSSVLAPDDVVLNVNTGSIDISTFTSLTGLGPWLGGPAAALPVFGADTTQDLLNKLMKYNGHSDILLKEDVIITPDPAYRRYYTNKIQIEVINPNSLYKGTQSFEYYRSTVEQVIGNSQYENYIVYDSAKDLRQNLVDAYQAVNVAFDPMEVENTPIKPVRQEGFNANGLMPWDFTEVMYAPDSLYLGSGSLDGGSTLRMVNNDLYPFEAIVSFNVTAAGTKNLFSTTNAGTMPVTIELLEKPPEFIPTTLDVNASFTTVQSLPVGAYKIRVTRPDSYKTPLKFNSSLQITRIFKVKGHDLTEMFRYCTTLTTIDAGSFDESTYTFRAPNMFDGCTTLASLPNGIFNSLKRCFVFRDMFDSTTALTTIPNDLFAFIRGYGVDVRSMFSNAGPTVIPADMFKDAHYIDLGVLFQNSTNVEEISSGLIANMGLKRRVSMVDMFNGCTKLEAVPADLFTGLVPPRTLTYNVDYNGDWNFAGAFRNCIALTTVPATLFTNLFVASGFSYAAFTNTFAGCTAFTTVPPGLFDGAKAPSAGLFGLTFSGCTALASIPAEIFQNTVLRTEGILGPGIGPTLQETFKFSGLATLPLGLFINNEDITQLKQTFQATKITEIPVGFLSGLVALEEMSATFENCPLLTAIPSDLFAHTPALKKASTVFYECPGLTTLPADLLTPATALEETTGMFAYTNITAIPAGFFATNAALKEVGAMFTNSKLAGTLDNIFTNQPLLTSAQTTFASNPIASLGANVFSGAPLITNMASCFSFNPTLTSVHADLLKFQTGLLNVSGLFQGCSGLPAIPGTLFATCPEITNVMSLFNNCAALTAIPSTLFSNTKKVTIAVLFASGCTSLAAIPPGIFDGWTQVDRMYEAFKGCTQIPAVPDELFKDCVLVRDYSNCFDGCTSLTTIGANLFGLSTVAVTLEEMFQHTGVLNVPDGIFFNLKNITSLYATFCNNPQLVSVGRLVQNTLSSQMYVDAILSGDPNNQVPPAVYPDFTIADNLIDSTIPLNLTTQYYGPPLGRRGLLTKDITNLFGANCKIVLASINKNWFQGTKVVGSGQSFITKHQIAATTGSPSIFTGVTTLSDYATLPAWSKA